MANKMKFLRLLHCRTTYTSEDWFAFDVSKTKTAWENGGLVTEYCSSSMITHGTGIGRFVPWRAYEAHRFDSMGFPGHESLSKLKWCSSPPASHFRGHPRRRWDRNNVPACQNDPSLSKANSRQETRSRSMLFRHRGLERAPHIQYSNVLDPAISGLQEAEDNLCFLQTDPKYVQDRMKHLRTPTWPVRLTKRSSLHMSDGYSQNLP
jgi:hypothetical protein